MTDILEPIALRLEEIKRIWLDAEGPGLQTRLFRKTIESEQIPWRVELALCAESIYHLWVNGQYVHRGPKLHHPHRWPVEMLDLTAFWRAGKNVVAVLVWERNACTHNSIPANAPGLVAKLSIEQNDGSTVAYTTDNSWKVTDKTGYSPDVPMRGWALGQMEVLDGAVYPMGWQSIDFDDHCWSFAEEFPNPSQTIKDFCWIDPDTPNLQNTFTPVARLLGVYEAENHLYPITAETKREEIPQSLLNTDWRPQSEVQVLGLSEEGGFVVKGLKKDQMVSIVLDLGREHTGTIEWDVITETAGVVDTGFAERLFPSGHGMMDTKGVCYMDRIHLPAGRFEWRQVNFTAGRYIEIVLHGFEGAVRFDKLGMRSTQPALHWGGEFRCSDPTLTSLFRMCKWSMRVGTQEHIMDCPTREQAAYVGDGHPECRWIGQLTGDWRFWKSLVNESLARPTRRGTIRTTVFTGASRCLSDYMLLEIIGVRDYLRFTHDTETVRPLLKTLRGLFNFFEDFRDEAGLLQYGLDQTTYACQDWEMQYDPEGWDKNWDAALFIDHAGMGWHCQEEPGVDRNGVNAAINALYVMARRAMAEIEDYLGTECAKTNLAEADKTAAIAKKTFWDKKRQFFADGDKDGVLLEQISEQTNTWCIMAGLCNDKTAKSILKRLLEEGDKTVARSGPYFWYYIYEELIRLDMIDLALKKTRELWKPMLQQDATCLWETFSGDQLDSWCHPWSAAPMEFLLATVLGLNVQQLRSEKPEIRPRYDLLDNAQGRVVLPQGAAELAWKKTGEHVELNGKLPEGFSAKVISPKGKYLGQVEGQWELSI